MVIIYIVGIGTFVNTAAIVVGGFFGYIFQRLLKQSLQKSILQAIGVAVIFIGSSGTLAQMFIVHQNHIEVTGILMATISLTLGTLLGELINIDARFTKLGQGLNQKVSSEDDNQFVAGFVNATLTVCVGAMAIIGPLQDALQHDPNMLFTKALLDGVIVAIYTATFGLGATFSALPVFIFQIAITILATLIAPFLSTAMTDGISLVGSMMIFCIGINLLLDTKIKVSNMLPALLIVIVYTIL